MGVRAVASALAAGVEVVELYVAPDLLLGADAWRLVKESGLSVTEVAASAFASLTPHVRSDGLLATVARPVTDLAILDPPSSALLAVAVGIERPGNLGTFVRTACAAGVNGVVLADLRTDPYHRDAIRASVGTVFYARPVVASTAEVLAWLGRRRFRIVATTPAGEVDYSHGDYRGDVAIAVGSERHGLPAAWIEAADHRVAIPMLGAADSLNVAVASGVVLFQAVASRHA